MLPWAVYYKQGLQRLTRHEPHRALNAFRAAISACPVTQASQLARILFYAGVTLKKLGAHDEAVRTWAVSQNLIKRGIVLRYMRWFSNDYGMAKQDFADLDDWRAFYAVQLKNYLKIKRSSRILSRGEEAMIRDLIYDAWISLKSSGHLEGKDSKGKMEIFQTAAITFPLPSPLGNPIDYSTKR